MTPQNPDDPNDDLSDNLSDPLDFDAEVQENFSDDEYTDAELADDGNYDEAEIYDENWDEESLDAAPAAKPKKKSSLFTILLIGGAVVVGVGILAFTLSGKKSVEPASSVEQQADGTVTTSPDAPDTGLMAMQPTSEQVENPVPVPDTQPAPVIETTEQKGFMNDPSQLQGDTPPSDVDEAATDAPGLPEQPSMTGIEEAPASSAAKDSGVTLTQSDTLADTPPSTDLPVPQNLPSIDAIKKAAPAMEEKPAVVTETPTPAEPLKPVVAAKVETAKVEPAPTLADTSVQSAHEAELQAKLDESSDKIAALEKKMDEMAKAAKAAPAPVTPVANDNSAEVEKLQATIAKLEDKVSDLSSRPAPTTVYTSEEPAPKPVRKVRKKKPVVRDEASYSSTPSGMWELRGARPGEAMIGKSGQAGLQTVRVGDNLSGIGQVRSIAQVGGRWIVQGSSGSIAQ